MIRSRLPARLAAATLLLLTAACGPREAPPEAGMEGADLAEFLGGDAEGYTRALAPRPFVFPADHGPHPDFRSEWWYFTGNLETPEGRPFGFQLTLFRFALAPEAPARESAWATRQSYMGHFALADIARERFFPFQRLARGAAGLAGAEAGPLRVWLGDWTITGAGGEQPRFNLEAAEEGVGIALELESTKPLVLQGDRGLSQKSADPGNASFYYSLTRLAARGTVTVDGEEYAVAGAAWLDREWSTSALAPDQAGWDWFALQLDDGRDLM
jgi:predicted secreted hydrolase